jgi:hypothetical protein
VATHKRYSAATALRSLRNRGAAVLAVLSLIMMSGGLVLMTGGSASATTRTVHKSYVCKYVGTPGVDERLQTGQNPIWVDNHALLGHDGTTHVGQAFSDAHGKSVVIVANTGKLTPEPSVSDCPAPQGPPEVTTVTPLFPSATEPTCALAGHLVVPAEPTGVLVTGGGADGAGPGTYVFTFAPKAGFAFPSGTQTTRSVTVLDQLTGEQCGSNEIVTVTPLYPSATEATCESSGHLSVPQQPDGVLVDGGGPDGAGAGTYVFHYAPAAGFAFPEGTATTKTVDVEAQVTGPACSTEDISVTPLYPSATAPTCKAAGTLVVPEQPTGVLVQGGGTDGAGPGTYSFVYSAQQGYVFPAGTDTTKTVTVQPKKTSADCSTVKGTDAGRTPPVVKGISNLKSGAHAPAVAGTAVPTAVDAGLAGTPQTDVRVLVGQLLLGGGLLMLVGSGLGLRRRGVRQV